MLTNNSLLIATKFFLETKDVTVTDGTVYSASTPATPASVVRGMLRITGPSGIFYVNPNYGANTFADADIDGSVGMSKSGISLPLDANGKVLQGAYLFDYRVGLKYRTLTFNEAGSEIIIEHNATGRLTPGAVFLVLSSSLNNGIKTVVSSTYDSGTDTTSVIVSQAVVNETSLDGYTILGSFEKRFTYNYCFEEPEISLSVLANCFCSKLTSTDTSNYTSTCNGVSVSPTLVQRVHTINYPFGSSPVNPVVTGNGAVLTTVENIWTGKFHVTLETTLNYVLSGGLLLETVLNTSSSIEVACNDCICDMLECVSALNTRYAAALGNNKRMAETLFTRLLRINTYGLLFANAVNCGNWDLAQEACDNMKVLLALDCDCCNDTPSGSQEVLPLCTSGGGGSNLNLTTSGNGVDISVSGDGLTYVFSLNQTIVQNIVQQYITENNVNNTDGITLTGINASCFSISDGMTLTEAWNVLLERLCFLINNYVIGKDDFKRGEPMEMPFTDYAKQTYSYVDASGGGIPIVRIPAGEYYVDGQNTSKLIEDVLLFNNSDCYVYLNNADEFNWAVTAVPIGDPAPATSGTKVFMVTTGAGIITMVTPLLGYHPVTTENSAFDAVYIMPDQLSEKETNGNFRFIPIGGSLYLQQRVGGTWTNIMKF